MSELITPVPFHVAIIMDGNGRWAKQRNLERSKGHEAGAAKLKELISCCMKAGVKELSVFAFSTENWRRPEQEVKAIFSLLSKHLKPLEEEFIKNKISLKVFGNIENLAQSAALKAAEIATNKGTNMRFNLGLNYGSIDEVARAAQKLAKSKTPISSQNLLNALDISTPVDLLIRTGGRARLSNFMLLQSAYAHIVFSDTLFPDFSEQELEKIIFEYRKIPRTFGGI